MDIVEWGQEDLYQIQENHREEVHLKTQTSNSLHIFIYSYLSLCSAQMFEKHTTKEWGTDAVDDDRQFQALFDRKLIEEYDRWI